MVYTIQFEDEPISGLEKFLCDPEVQTIQGDYEFISTRIDDIPNRLGINREYFRQERGDFVFSLPGLYEEIERQKGAPQLRLGCIIWNDRTLILGGGGIKPQIGRAW